MEKYVNKYRVQVERDIHGEPMEFTYLQCIGKNKGGEVRRYSDDILVAIVIGKSIGKANNMFSNISKVIGNDKNLKRVDYEFESDIYFSESNLDKLAEVLCVKTTGASIPARSLKNHPRYKEIKQERFEALTNEQKQDRIDRGKRLSELKEKMDREKEQDNE